MPRKKKGKRPPCPDPERYEWVNSKEGGYWRLKKWLDKPVELNNALARNAELTKPTNEAATRLLFKLTEFTKYMVKGRLTARVAGAFKKSCFKNDSMDFSFLNNFEFHKDYPFNKLCNTVITVKEGKDSLDVHLRVGTLYVKKQSNLVTGYHLNGILIFGDPGKANALRIEVLTSPSYSFEGPDDEDCYFPFVLPTGKKPWMVLLHIECELFRSTPPSPTNCRMKVIRTGGGK
jgi:hypothetical protein